MTTTSAMLASQLGTDATYTDGVTVSGSAQFVSGTAGNGGQAFFTIADVGLTLVSANVTGGSALIQSLNWTTTDLVTNGTKTVTSASAKWTQDDVNCVITSTTGNLAPFTYIASVTNATTALLNQNATNSGTGNATVVRGGQYCTLSKTATASTTASFTVQKRINPIDLAGTAGGTGGPQESTAGVQAWIDSLPDDVVAYIPKTAKLWCESTLLLSNRELTVDGSPIKDGILSNNATTAIATVAGSPTATAVATGNIVSTAENFTFSDIDRVIYDAATNRLLACAYTDGLTDGTDVFCSAAATFTSADLGCLLIGNDPTANNNVISPSTVITTIIDAHRVRMNQASPANLSTVVLAASDGVAVSSYAGSGVLNVASTAGFPSSGTVGTVTTTGYATISYGAIGSATTLTSCTTVTGTGNLIGFNTIGVANQLFVIGRNTIVSVQGPHTCTVAPTPSAGATTGLTILNRVAPGSGALIYQLTDGTNAPTPISKTWPCLPITPAITTTVAAGSNLVLSNTFTGSGTLNVASASSFPTSGTITVGTTENICVINYTNTTGTTFTGCTTVLGASGFSTGAFTTGATVTAAVIAYQLGASAPSDYVKSWPTNRAGLDNIESKIGYRNLQVNGYSGNDFRFDGVLTSGSPTLTSASAAFTTAVNGCPVYGYGIPANTTVTYASATTVTMSNNANATNTLDAAGAGLCFTIQNRNPVGDLGPGITNSPYSVTTGQYGINFKGSTGLVDNVRATNSWVEAFSGSTCITGSARPADRNTHDVRLRNCYFGGTQRFVFSLASANGINFTNGTVEAGKTGCIDIEPDGAQLGGGDINLVNLVIGAHGASGAISLGGQGQGNALRILNCTFLTDMHINIGTAKPARNVVDISGNIALETYGNAITISVSLANLVRAAGNIIPVTVATHNKPTSAATITKNGSAVITFKPADNPTQNVVGSLVTTPGNSPIPLNTYILRMGPGLNQATLSNTCVADSSTAIVTIKQLSCAFGDNTTYAPGVLPLDRSLIGPNQVVAW